MARNNKTSSSSKFNQANQNTVLPKQNLSLGDQNSTRSVRLDVDESADIHIASESSAPANQVDNQFNAQGITNPKKKAKKRQTSLNDVGLGKLIGEYDMYINRSEKRLMLLQYPNRDIGQSYCERIGLKPLEIRIKPKCGLVEVDIPMVLHSNFNKEKGIQYGQAMRKSRVLQEGGSYGLAGGLRAGLLATKLRLSNQDQNITSEEPSIEALLENFEDANNKGHVMNKLTLGGRIVPWADGYPIYYIGVFKGKTISLNRLDAMVQLRPLFTHLDALAEQDKSTLTSKLRGGAENPVLESEAKAVNMRAKSTDVDDTDAVGSMSGMAQILKAMREEAWQRLSWIDSEDERSYKMFTDEMFVQDIAGAPQLVSTMTNEQWLDAISCPRIDPITQGKKVFMSLKSDSETSDTDSSDNESVSE